MSRKESMMSVSDKNKLYPFPAMVIRAKDVEYDNIILHEGRWHTVNLIEFYRNNRYVVLKLENNDEDNIKELFGADDIIVRVWRTPQDGSVVPYSRKAGE